MWYKNKDLLFGILKKTGIALCCVVAIGTIILISMYLGSVIIIRNVANGRIMLNEYVAPVKSPSENGTTMDKTFESRLLPDSETSPPKSGTDINRSIENRYQNNPRTSPPKSGTDINRSIENRYHNNPRTRQPKNGTEIINSSIENRNQSHSRMNKLIYPPQTDKRDNFFFTRFMNNEDNKRNRPNLRKSKECKPLPPSYGSWNCGSRISDRKCCDYIWEMNHKKEILEYYNCIHENQLSVIGGQETSNEIFPHMAAIGYKLKIGQYKFMCGGSLISDRFVLTAGHCTYAAEVQEPKTLETGIPAIVRLGSKNIINEIIDSNRKDIAIDEVISHPNYKSPKKYYDIALLRLIKKVIFTEHIHPACISTKLTPKDQKVNITGWGAIDMHNTMSDVLRMATVDIIEHNDCVNKSGILFNRNFKTLEPHQFCTVTDGIDTCAGDSGGPLQIRINTVQGSMHNVVGVTSMGHRNCAIPDVPAVNIKVDSVIDWIESKVWADEYKG